MAARTDRAPEPQPQAEPSIVLSVRLTDGTFESHVTVPVSSPKADKDAAVNKWLSIMQFGLSMHGDDVRIDTVISAQGGSDERS